MKIYEKIFDRLDELHMSQMELSRRTGIATSTISDWRKKKINPQADKIVSICRALDMSLVDLLCDEETVEPAAQIDCLTNENYMIELFRQSDAESKRRIISYIELLEVCKQINNACQSRKRQRNVSIIQDIDGNNIVVINDIRFKGKRSINWREIRAYLKEYVGDFYMVASTGDVIYIGGDGDRIAEAGTLRDIHNLSLYFFLINIDEDDFRCDIFVRQCIGDRRSNASSSNDGNLAAHKYSFLKYP